MTQAFLTQAETASEMGINYSAVLRLLRQGRIEGAKKFAGRWLIPTPIRLRPGRRGPKSRWEREGGRLMVDNMAIHYSSDTPEWNTPNHVIEKVTSVFGEIDLDPCSNSHETPAVPARTHYTVIDDGLTLPWEGKIYMNPPYGREISSWVKKLSAEYRLGNVTQAIALVPARTDAKWFGMFKDFTKCFIKGRLKFGDQRNSAPFPSVAVYLGNDAGSFIQEFKNLGDLYATIS